MVGRFDRSLLWRYNEKENRMESSDNLQFPSFLARPRTDETRAIADAILAQRGAGRIWAPIRKIEELERIKANLEKPRIWVADPTLPVQVVTTKKQNLQFYEDYAAFEKFHDREDFPIKQVVDAEGMTYIVVKSEAALNGLSDALKDLPREKAEVITQNDVKRPKAGSITGIAWATFDGIWKGCEGNKEAFALAFKSQFEKLKAHGMNPSTIRTQFAHWRKFNGISK